MLIEFRSLRPNPDPRNPDDTYLTRYFYDEAGNRIRKATCLPAEASAQAGKYHGSEIEPIFNEGDAITWELISSEFYVRDVSGKEVALYEGTSLDFWNIWGLDNVGRINPDNSKYFYLKDHLGSVRCIIDQNNNIISAQDYDAWGYLMENRTYESGTSKYKFTGKERDNESNYDYFGARYYDSRIGRWGSVDSLFMAHYDFSPYNYAINNPVRYYDPKGLDPRDWFIRFLIRIGIQKGIEKISGKTMTPELAEEGFGTKGEDVDKDGIEDNLDIRDNRSREQKIADEIKKRMDKEQIVDPNNPLVKKEEDIGLEEQGKIVVKEVKEKMKWEEATKKIEAEKWNIWKKIGP